MPKDQRMFMTFPNDFWMHPKVALLSVEAKWTFVEMNGYSRMQDLDGVIPTPMANRLWDEAVLNELVASHPERPLVVRDSDNLIIRDYAEHQQTTADREDLSKKRSDAGVKGRAKQLAGKDWASAEQVPGQIRAEIEIEIEIEKEKELSAGDTSSAKRAHRLPNDFELTPTMTQWAKDHTPGMDYKTATATFIDYWQSAGGANARKMDWVKAWQVWMRKDFQQMTPGARVASVTQMPADRKVADLFCPTHPGYPLKDCNRCREVA